MNKVLALLFIVILMSGCCAFTSQDCNCKPPAPELSDEVRSWIAPYDDLEYLIFENDNNELDSLKIERLMDTEYLGGEECGIDGLVERAILESEKFTNLLFTVEATRNNFVAINYLKNQEEFINVTLNTQDDNLVVSNLSTTGSFIDDYIWGDETIPVLSVICTGSTICLDYQMKEIVVSQNFGLLKYVDMAGEAWVRVN